MSPIFNADLVVECGGEERLGELVAPHRLSLPVQGTQHSVHTHHVQPVCKGRADAIATVKTKYIHITYVAMPNTNYMYSYTNAVNTVLRQPA